MGIVEEAGSITALASALELPGNALSATINAYNGFVRQGQDAQFQRPDLPQQLTSAPYYAIEVTPAVHHTMGGVAIDPQTRVQDEQGEAIPGLYAAGEATGGVHGSNRLGGNAVSDIVTFGRIAGAEAAGYAGTR